MATFLSCGLPVGRNTGWLGSVPVNADEAYGEVPIADSSDSAGARLGAAVAASNLGRSQRAANGVRATATSAGVANRAAGVLGHHPLDDGG